MTTMRQCPKCDSPMQEAQDWCIKCGAAQSGGRLAHAPGWLTGALVMAVTALLVAGASVAAYAALSKHSPKRPIVVATRTSTTGTTGATLTPGAASSAPTTPGGTTPTSPSGTPPPKIPTQTPTPSPGKEEKSANNLLFPPEGKESKSSKSKSEGNKKEGVKESGGGEGSKGEESSKASKEAPEPILLDTNAASTYNPNGYPSTDFGDPSLTIDGESSTAWTAAVEAATAPVTAVGVVLDLKTAQKLGSAAVKTSTPGMIVEAYGANGHELPAAITDPAWKPLHGRRLLRRKDVTFKLDTKGAAYRFFLLWVVKAPAHSTPATPGQVAISELELFPPTK